MGEGVCLRLLKVRGKRANHLEPKPSRMSKKMSTALGAGLAVTNEPKTMNRAECPLALAMT